MCVLRHFVLEYLVECPGKCSQMVIPHCWITVITWNAANAHTQYTATQPSDKLVLLGHDV